MKPQAVHQGILGN